METLTDWNKPTRDDIESITVGGLAPNCLGQLAQVTSIFALGEDIKGKKYICYYVKFSENATISHSLTEGEFVKII